MIRGGTVKTNVETIKILVFCKKASVAFIKQQKLFPFKKEFYLKCVKLLLHTAGVSY